MVWVFGILLALGGAVIFAVSAKMIISVNPESRVPQWFGRPERHPGRAYVVRGSAVFALMAGALLLADEIGPWALVLVLIGAVPAVALVSRHNRDVKRARAG